MPATAFLHIQSRDHSAARVIELPGLSVRVGQGADCEVRLDDPALLDVQCHLLRRGSTWHIQPMGPPGPVSIDGRPVDVPRPLAFGSAIRVGDHWLTIRPAAPASEVDRGPLATPSITAGVVDPDRDQLARWQARLQQRERWLKDRLEERKWEARWRAAGETQRARGTSAPVAPKPAPAPAPTRPVEPRRAAPRPVEPSLFRASTPPLAPHTPKPPSAASIAPPTPEPIPVPVGLPALFVGPADGLDDREPDPTAEEVVAVDSAVPTPVEVPVEAELEEPAAEPDGPAGFDSIRMWAGPPGGSATCHSATPRRSPGAPATRRFDTAGPGVDDDVEVVVRRKVAPTIVEMAPPGEPEANEPADDLPDLASIIALPATTLESSLAATAAEPGVATDVADASAASPGGWPSVRSMMPRHSATSKVFPTRKVAGRRAKAGPAPTIERAPDCWRVPLWLAWPTATAAALALGTIGIGLSWGWSQDDLADGLVANRLLQPDGPAAVTAAQLDSPDLPWWRTTSQHLYRRAFALDRMKVDADPGRVRSLLASARSAAPLDPEVRFAEARAIPGDDGPAPLSASLGLSRDVATLAWSGHRLAEVGKPEPALRAYRMALELINTVEPARLQAPMFDEDPQVRRYALPAEDMLGAVVRDMAGRDGWTYSDWTPALPDTELARLVAARVLRDRGETAEADRMLGAIVDQPEPIGTGADVGLARAIRGEALAMLGRWAQAESSYREAVAAMPEGPIRRSWWVNLADLSDRLNDPVKKREALDLARTGDPHDEVSRRAIEIQKLDGTARRARSPAGPVSNRER